MSRRLPLQAGAGWAAVAIALILVVAFDLQRTVALDDDWAYVYDVQRLVGGAGLHLYPWDSSVHFVQTLWGAAASFGHPQPWLLRLTVVPFAVLLAAAAHLTARELGADQFWSGVAAAAALVSPLMLSVTAAFMTDTYYVALLMAAAWASLRWWRGWRWAVLAAGLLVLAALQRQHGLLLAGIAPLAALLAWRRRGVRAYDFVVVAALVVVDVGVLELPTLIGTPAVERDRMTAILQVPNPRALVEPLFVLPAMLAGFATPFFGAVSLSGLHRRRGAILLALVAALATAFLVLASSTEQLHWANKWQPAGIGPWTIGGAKSHVPGMHLYFKVAFLALPVALAAWIWHARPWPAQGWAAGDLLLVAAALSQMVPMIQTGSMDRYWLPVLVPLAPVLARRATLLDPVPVFRVVTVGALALDLFLFGWMEADSIAWHQAADAAARLAYEHASPLEVAAGYENNSYYAVLPYFDKHGDLPHTGSGDSSLTDAETLMEFGAKDPRYVLCFADRNDDGPGVSYGGPGPGRIAIRQSGC